MEKAEQIQINVKDKAKKAKRGLLSIVFSRSALIVLLLLVQVWLFFAPTTFFGQYARWITTAFNVLRMLAIIYIINEKGNPAFKMTWILLILIAPAAGTAFYFFVKLQPGTKYTKLRLNILENEIKPYLKQNPAIVKSLRVSKPANGNLAHYMSHQINFPVYRNTSAVYFPLGEDKFEELKRQLEKAEKFIFLEYFIVEEGVMWNSVLEILERKVRQGVEVRFLYDGMCSMFQLPYNYPKEMRRCGIKCKIANPIRPVLSSKQNNRDHRKICVIDGKVAFTGGVNLADEYINVKERFGHWKDTAIMLEGEAVRTFTLMFLQMWNIDEKKPREYEKYLCHYSDGFRRELGYVIPYGDSPYDNENVGEYVYMHILNHAKKYVHIMTPYLIIDNEMQTALTNAAKSGVEVTIIMPHIPDKWYAFAVAKTYYAELLNAGVHIYEYTPGFVHAKVFVSDDDTATVGTINLDYRSFYHHFECGVFVYNNPVVRSVERDFQNTLDKCQRITIKDVNSMSLFMRVAGRVLRLIAPLM